MGRPPSGMGVMKKGQWTPEEDLMLASHIQENGPGNWSSVPKNTGLERCSKSCRLRWLNHLRPGLKRRNFTAEEDRKIINLQAVLGNKWAAIASHLPERTDNDIKNYWNAHLKKNADRAHGSCSGDQRHAGSGSNTTTSAPDLDSDFSKGCWEKRLQVNASAAHPTATLPRTAPGQRSPLAVATAPLLSSGCMSFKPPRGWNLNAHQQLMIPANHQYRSQAAPVTRASNYSTEPYVFNCENIALWLQSWNKKTPLSKLDNGESVLTKKKDDFNRSGAAAERVCSL